jgi:hypothetical protein
VQGYRKIPSLMTALANTVSKKGVAEELKVGTYDGRESLLSTEFQATSTKIPT